MNDKIVIMIGFFASTVVGIAVMSYPGADPPKRTTEPVITDEKQTSLLRQVDKYEKLVKESLDHLNTFLDEEEPEKVRVCATHSIRDIAEQRKKVLDLREAVATRWANLEPDNQQGVATSLSYAFSRHPTSPPIGRTSARRARNGAPHVIPATGSKRDSMRRTQNSSLGITADNGGSGKKRTGLSLFLEGTEVLLEDSSQGKPNRIPTIRPARRPALPR